MSYEVTSRSVLGGICKELGTIFPEVTIYEERVAAQYLHYPHFYVNQLTTDIEPERYNRWWLRHLLTLQYRIKADASNTEALHEQLDTVAIKLLSELEHIYLDTLPVRIKRAHTEKVDGVLHWFGNIDVLVYKSEAPAPLQERLTVTISPII